MAKQRGYIAVGLGTLLICLTGFMGLLSFSGLSEAGQTGLKPNTPSGVSENLVKSYGDQAAFVQSEIEKLQQEKKWLSLKIKKMEDSKRDVPRRMYDSMAFKESKISALEKLKSRYKNLIRSAAPSPPPVKKTKSNPKSGFAASLKQRISASGLADWVELSSANTPPLRVENRLPILFPSGSAAIAKGYDAFIQNLATLVKGYDVRIIVDGYADTDPIRTPKYASNFELGAARAAAVVHSFVKYGIKPSVFKIGSTGEHRLDSRKASEWKNLQRHANITILFRGKL